MMDLLCGDKAKERWPGQVIMLTKSLYVLFPKNNISSSLLLRSGFDFIALCIEINLVCCAFLLLVHIALKNDSLLSTILSGAILLPVNERGSYHIGAYLSYIQRITLIHCRFVVDSSQMTRTRLIRGFPSKFWCQVN